MFSKISFCGLLTSAAAIQLGVQSEVTDPKNVDIENQIEPLADNKPGLSMKHLLGGVIGGLCIGAAITAGVFVATDNDNDNGGSGVDASGAKGWTPSQNGEPAVNCQDNHLSTDGYYFIDPNSPGSFNTNINDVFDHPGATLFMIDFKGDKYGALCEKECGSPLCGVAIYGPGSV